MRNLFVVILLGLSACYGSESQLNDEDQLEDSSSNGVNTPPRQGHEPGCGVYKQMIRLPNGGYFFISLPAQCQPFYFDMGDPPDQVNPDPEELNDPSLDYVNEYRNEFIIPAAK